MTQAQKDALKRALIDVNTAREDLSEWIDRPHLDQYPAVLAAAEKADEALESVRKEIKAALGNLQVSDPPEPRR